MSHKIQHTNQFRNSFIYYLAGYLYPVMPISGMIILSALILAHILRTGASLTTNEKISYLSLILISGIFIVSGILSRTKTGVRIIARVINCPEEFIFDTRQQIDYKFIEFLLVLLVFLSIFLFSLDTKIAVYNLDAARYFNDTPGYLGSGSSSPLDRNFLMGKRPVTLPIFYQLVGYTLQNYSDQAEMEKVGRTQLGISIISWALLAFSFSLLMNKYALRFLTFMIIIMMGASINITMWDRLMLSDSLSTSLFALLLAYMICISMIWRNKTSLKLWLQIILVIFCIVIALLYSFTRDPNAYFLGSLGLLMMFGILFRSIRKHPLIAGYMVIMFSFFTIFGFQNYLVINSFRDVSSLQHVFVYRFIPDKDRLAFLLDNGMPYDQRFSSYTNLNLKELQLQLSIDDPSGLLMTWIENHGKPVLLKYMISHPTYIFITPLTDLQAMINGNVAGYRKPLSSTPFRLSLLSDFFYPRMTILPYLFIAFFGISLFLLFVNKTSNLLLILVLVLYITAIPFLMLVWNSDTNDIPRHSLQAAIQLRQASWVCFLLLIERFWIFFEKKFQKNKSSFVSAS